MYYQHYSLSGNQWVFCVNTQTMSTTITANRNPTVSVTSPNSNQVFGEVDSIFTPSIAVSDVDNDTLTCKYYVDSETTPRETKTVSNTVSTQTVSFNALNVSTLTEGNHTIKFEVNDGIAPSVRSQ